MGTAAPLLINQIFAMNFLTEQLRLSSIRPHPPQNWTATKDIIHEMTQVYGKVNAPAQNTVYHWKLETRHQNGRFEQQEKERTNLELLNRN